MSVFSYRVILVCVFLVGNFAVYGQVDSTFIKGELVLEDGFYGADKEHYENPLFYGSKDSDSFYFLDKKAFLGLNENVSCEYRFQEPDGWHGLIIRFKDDSKEFWRELTKKQVMRSIVLIVNNKVVSTWGVVAEVPTGIMSVGGPDWTKKEIMLLKEAIDK